VLVARAVGREVVPSWLPRRRHVAVLVAVAVVVLHPRK
jgi:hypothetical protein